ncbi:MAG TPA: hypothetical protein VLJ59_15920 [Mycobacteriales bacterium]|nr:hypothetical protein [Mycobacteriales bacterium]
MLDDGTAPQPLTRPMVIPTGTSVRDLGMGQLIGRRRELRDATAVLRRGPKALDTWGAAAGAQLLGIGGIGKTGIAGRVMTRLRGDGWGVIPHDGRWNPTALFATAAKMLDAAGHGDLAAPFADMQTDDTHKFNLLCRLLAQHRVLLVFDDFEQNLTAGGQEFADASVEGLFGRLCDACRVGALLVTSRHPVPGADGLLVPIHVLPLSPSELRRMLLRLPALRDLGVADRALLARTIGGHPRLIEFVNALIRGGGANLLDVQIKLRALAKERGVDVSKPRPLGQAIDEAMVLGSADILLEQLLSLLNDAQQAVLRQIAVSRAPMTLDDLGYALVSAPVPPSLADTVELLADLTLVTSLGGAISMHPWTADLVTRNVDGSLSAEHERALAMRMRRFENGAADYLDLLEVPRHLAYLRRYDDAASVATEAAQMLSGTLATAAFLAEIRPMVPDTERAWILIADLEMQSVLSLGDLTAAKDLARQIDHQIAERAADLTNTEWQRDLSVSHERLGDLARAGGDLTAATRHYTAALTIRERLATADPTNTEWQRDLSISQNKLGDLAVAGGDLTTATRHYTAALTIRERLAAADPTNTEWQRDLSISHEKLGDLAVAGGDLTTATRHYTAALTIRERLAATDPTNTQWQRDLSWVHDRLAALRSPTIRTRLPKLRNLWRRRSSTTRPD